ncbi:MAG: regulatory protein RecX [Nitrospirae bacterium]|nr:regulatory protein RecX [Nitrospirota bacterium]
MKDSQADAKRYALRLISYRPRSRKEMFERLKTKGFSQEEIEVTFSFLHQAGLINDEALAAGLITHAVEKKMLGRRGAEAFLLKRGIEKDTARKLITCRSEEDEKGSAEKLVAKKLASLKNLPQETKKRRLYGMLQRRGFSADVIRNVVSSALK